MTPKDFSAAQSPPKTLKRSYLLQEREEGILLCQGFGGQAPKEMGGIGVVDLEEEDIIWGEVKWSFLRSSDV